MPGLPDRRPPNRLHRRQVSGQLAGMPHLTQHGRRIEAALGVAVVTAEENLAAQRQVDEVRTGVVAPWTVRPEVRDPDVDQPRVDLPQALITEAARVERTRRVAVQQHVGRPGEIEEPLPPFRCFQVQCDALLAEVVVPEVETALRIAGRLHEPAAVKWTNPPAWRAT